MHMKKFISGLCLFLVSVSLSAQELICNVQVNSDQIQGTNKSVFNTLEKSISEFVNNRRWTSMGFTSLERIECTMSIILKSIESDVFNGEIIIQSRRPVFNSSYTTTLFNFRDQNFSFTYRESDQLEFNENALSSNLTAVLAYYCYIIVGYDTDSYARLGGTPAFRAAENIVNMAQSTEWSGWKAFESSKNRYALVNNLLDESFKKYRNYFYEYHRLGLDEMVSNVANARARIAAGLPVLRETNRSRPSTIVIASFMETKSDELIQIFSKALDSEKKLAVEILSDVNPTQTARYEEIFNKK